MLCEPRLTKQSLDDDLHIFFSTIIHFVSKLFLLRGLLFLFKYYFFWFTSCFFQFLEKPVSVWWEEIVGRSGNDAKNDSVAWIFGLYYACDIRGLCLLAKFHKDVQRWAIRFVFIASEEYSL